MGFLSKLNPLKAPGMGLLTKPVNKLMRKTPGLKGVPGRLGMGGPNKKKSPIAPSPAVVGAGIADANKMGAQNTPPPQMSAPVPQMAPQAMPQMQPQMQPQMPYEAPEAVMGAEEMAMQPQMTAPPPQIAPQEQMGLEAPQPASQMMSPAIQNLRQRMRNNTGVARYNQGGIGPRFMQ